HSLQCEVAIAFQSERLELGLVEYFGDIERDPAVVSQIRWDRVTRIVRHQQLRVDTDPEYSTPNPIVTVCPRKDLLPCTPYRLTKLQSLGSGRQSKADFRIFVRMRFPRGVFFGSTSATVILRLGAGTDGVASSWLRNFSGATRSYAARTTCTMRFQAS